MQRSLGYLTLSDVRVIDLLQMGCTELNTLGVAGQGNSFGSRRCPGLPLSPKNTEALYQSIQQLYNPFHLILPDIAEPWR